MRRSPRATRFSADEQDYGGDQVYAEKQSKMWL